jgi:hypothetical protein
MYHLKVLEGGEVAINKKYYSIQEQRLSLSLSLSLLKYFVLCITDGCMVMEILKIHCLLAVIVSDTNPHSSFVAQA